jgi:hypothetical protein
MKGTQVEVAFPMKEGLLMGISEEHARCQNGETGTAQS